MRLLLDSRVVDWPRSSNLIVVTLSSLKPLFFNEYRTIETHGARFWVCRATRNRPFLRHCARATVLPAKRARKLSTTSALLRSMRKERRRVNEVHQDH